MEENNINNEAQQRPQVSAEKLKALQIAMDKIDKSFGRGSIMKLGDESIENVEVSSRFSDLNQAVKPPWPSMPLPKRRNKAVSLLLLMPNMHSIAFMPKLWELT